MSESEMLDYFAWKRDGAHQALRKEVRKREIACRLGETWLQRNLLEIARTSKAQQLNRLNERGRNPYG